MVATSIEILTEQEKIIIDFLKINNKIKSLDLEKLLNVRSARARRILKGMVDKNLVERKGKGKNTFYEIKR